MTYKCIASEVGGGGGGGGGGYEYGTLYEYGVLAKGVGG